MIGPLKLAVEVFADFLFDGLVAIFFVDAVAANDLDELVVNFRIFLGQQEKRGSVRPLVGIEDAFLLCLLVAARRHEFDDGLNWLAFAIEGNRGPDMTLMPV